MSLDGGNSSQNSKKYQVLVDLSPSTPVVGCETNPGVRIGSQGPIPFNVDDKPPPYVCEFSWLVSFLPLSSFLFSLFW